MRLLLSVAFLSVAIPALADDIPRGEVTKYSFSNSKIFPGTVRDYWVYVPKQYEPSKPACVYVNQDGIQYNAPAVFDELIHKKEMPVTIGVFVMHGRVPSPSDDALPRFNRSYEYDGLGDNYARFLLEELLPDVEKKKTSAGWPIRLSKDGNDRAIGGASSGAICAFTAAWERPDDFTRVFSAIGTYVGLRGGNEYPTLIRKVEPSAIRVFLEDGENDLNIYGGDWWMANQEMERALRFAGYEVEHAWGKGGHDTKHATEIFPDAMRWLWKGWPERVKAGQGSQQLREIAEPGEEWTLVEGEVGIPYNPIAMPGGDVLLWHRVESGSPHACRIGADDRVVPFEDDRAVGFLTLRAAGPDGWLYGSDGEGTLARGPGGKSRRLARGIVPNSLIVRRDGGLYLVEFILGPIWQRSRIWSVAPGGETQRIEGSELFDARGIATSPDQTLLYVGDHAGHWVYSYQIQPDRSLAAKQKYYRLHVSDTTEGSGAWGMAVDRDGRLYVGTSLGVQVCDQAGRVNVILPTEEPVSSICFGGEGGSTLYIVCGRNVYQRRMKVRGANAFDPPHKPAQPRL